MSPGWKHNRNICWELQLALIDHARNYSTPSSIISSINLIEPKQLVISSHRITALSNIQIMGIKSLTDSLSIILTGIHHWLCLASFSIVFQPLISVFVVPIMYSWAYHACACLEVSSVVLSYGDGIIVLWDVLANPPPAPLHDDGSHALLFAPWKQILVGNVLRPWKWSNQTQNAFIFTETLITCTLAPKIKI